MAGGENNAPPVALPSRLVARDTQSIRVRGHDFIASKLVAETIRPGTVVLELELNSSLTARMSQHAASYQRAMWHSMTFEFVPGFASNAAGQYAAAFIRDPTDLATFTDEELISWVVGQQASTMSKWWQNSRVVVPGTADKLWTSPSVEDRLYSPGRIIVVCVGAPYQPGDLAIWIHWDITFSEPSLESSRSAHGGSDEWVLPFDTMLTRYPTNDSYMALSQYKGTGPYSLDPRETFTQTQWLTLGDLGINKDYPIGTIFRMESSAIISYQMHAAIADGEDHGVTVNVWDLIYENVGVLDYLEDHNHQITTKKVLVPVVPYRNKTSDSVVTNQDKFPPSGTVTDRPLAIWSVGISWPKGTRMRALDPTKEPEFKDVLIAGKWEKRPTGRMVPKQLDVNGVSWTDPFVPKVRIAFAGSGTANPLPQQVYINGGTLTGIDGVVKTDLTSWHGSSIPTSFPVNVGNEVDVNLAKVASIACPSQSGEVPTFIMGQSGNIAVSSGADAVIGGKTYTKTIPYVMDGQTPVVIATANGYINTNIARVGGHTTVSSNGNMPINGSLGTFPSKMDVNITEVNGTTLATPHVPMLTHLKNANTGHVAPQYAFSNQDFTYTVPAGVLMGPPPGHNETVNIAWGNADVPSHATNVGVDSRLMINPNVSRAGLAVGESSEHLNSSESELSDSE